MSIGFTAKLERPAHSIYNGSIMTMLPSKAKAEAPVRRERDPMEQFAVWQNHATGQRHLMEKVVRNDDICLWDTIKELP